MIIERNNMRLIRLTEDHIDLVRQKRNLPEIQKRMLYREYITPEMQKQWFNSINNFNNYYFLIETNSTLIGLISASGVDWEGGIVNNGGIFIWHENYLRSAEILYASVLLTDLGSYIGIKRNYIRILRDNSSAIAFNKSLGYELLPGQDDIYNQKYELTEENYFNATQKIRHLFAFIGKIKQSLTEKEYSDLKKFINFNSAEYRNNITIEVLH